MKRLCLSIAALLFILTSAVAGDEIRGKISSIDPATGSLDISGVKVLAKRARVKDEKGKRSSLADLKVGECVEAEGKFSGAGELTARKVERETFIADKISGKLEAVDVQGRALTISGITVKVPTHAWIEDRRDKRIPLAELPVGARIECKGTLTGPRELTAVKVEME